MCLWQWHVFFLLLAVAEGKQRRQNSKRFLWELLLSNQTELKTSDCFKKIRYVALETTDSCLVGQGAYATILNDWIVVTSGRDRCQLFDKNGPL